MRKTGTALIVIFLIHICMVSPAAAQAGTKPAAAPDWSRAVVESTMERYPTAAELGSWG